MTTMSSRDLLIEIGTEELPPKALGRMRDALQSSLLSLLEENGLAHGDSRAYATPRRLAVVIRDVPIAQADRDEGRRKNGLASAEREELRKLRSENRRLRVEREILN